MHGRGIEYLYPRVCSLATDVEMDARMPFAEHQIYINKVNKPTLLLKDGIHKKVAMTSIMSSAHAIAFIQT